MLTIQTSKSHDQGKTCVPNLLPVHLHHNGPINSTPQYWKPEKDESGKLHSYFRGRHLHGTTLKVPSTHTGAVLRVTDRHLPTTIGRRRAKEVDAGDDELIEQESKEEEVEVKVVEEMGRFEEVVLWGHGGEVNKDGDAFIRGIEEWVGFADAMHGDTWDQPEDQRQQEKKT